MPASHTQVEPSCNQYRAAVTDLDQLSTQHRTATLAAHAATDYVEYRRHADEVARTGLAIEALFICFPRLHL